MSINSNSVSIVIPVRNEAAKIAHALDGWLRQTAPVHQILVIDSGSDDGTVQICEGYPEVTVLQIAPSQFNHGDTRNYGVHHSEGEFTLMTVGDAIPANRGTLAAMLSHCADASVAGVCGNQIVEHAPENNPVDWFRPQSKPKPRTYQFGEEAGFDTLSPSQKRDAASWDDVLALYRTSVVKAIPFKHVTYGEDVAWAIDALRAGHKLVYEPSARVYHYHVEDPSVAYKRAMTTCYLRFRHFGLSPDSSQFSVSRLARASRTILRSRGITWKERAGWLRAAYLETKARERAVEDFLAAVALGDAEMETLARKHIGASLKVK